MLVYVVNKENKPLMPTRRFGKVRRLLKQGLAVVINREPFTVQLLFDTTSYIQFITLGVDTGSVHVGISASTESRELYSLEANLRTDIVDLLSTRRESRRKRRNRLRYRKPRFNNRTKKSGWLVPCQRHKIDSHIKLIKKVTEFLPISKIRIEVGNFDVQRINNQDIESVDYQHGNQFGFFNVREYVLCRDNHTCQCCNGKSKDKVLNVHHIESRKTGGDSPNNLITLCETCHKALHQGKLNNFKPKRNKSLRDTSSMNIIKCRIFEEVKKLFPDIKVEITYGYITKSLRIQYGLEKTHRMDALCITGNVNAIPCSEDEQWIYKQVRTRNRHIEKDTIMKGGKKKKNQSSYMIDGFRLFDKVKYNNQSCFITGKRTVGNFVLRDINYKLIKDGVYNKRKRQILFVDVRKSFIKDIVKNLKK